MIPRLSLLASLAMAVPALAEETVAFPDALEDTRWIAEGGACGSESEIRIEDGVILVMDGAMSALRITEDRQVKGRMEVDFLLSGGGEDWRETLVLSLSEDGSALTFDYEDGSSITWSRCS